MTFAQSPSPLRLAAPLSPSPSGPSGPILSADGQGRRSPARSIPAAQLSTSWASEVENLAVLSRQQGFRVIGVTSPHAGAGVSTLSWILAQTFSKSCCEALLLDLTQLAQDEVGQSSWSSPQDNAELWVQPDPGGFAYLTAAATRNTRAHFNDGELLSECLGALLKHYWPIVIDLAPLADRNRLSINPIPAASSCDAVILTCSRGRTTKAHIESTMAIADAHDVSIMGVVMNDLGPSTRPRGWSGAVDEAERPRGVAT